MEVAHATADQVWTVAIAGLKADWDTLVASGELAAATGAAAGQQQLPETSEAEDLLGPYAVSAASSSPYYISSITTSSSYCAYAPWYGCGNGWSSYGYGGWYGWWGDWGYGWYGAWYGPYSGYGWGWSWWYDLYSTWSGSGSAANVYLPQPAQPDLPAGFWDVQAEADSVESYLLADDYVSGEETQAILPWGQDSNDPSRNSATAVGSPALGGKQYGQTEVVDLLQRLDPEVATFWKWHGMLSRAPLSSRPLDDQARPFTSTLTANEMPTDKARDDSAAQQRVPIRVPDEKVPIEVAEELSSTARQRGLHKETDSNKSPTTRREESILQQRFAQHQAAHGNVFDNTGVDNDAIFLTAFADPEATAVPSWKEIHPWSRFPGFAEDWSRNPFDPRSNITSTKWADEWSAGQLKAFIRPFFKAWGQDVRQAAIKHAIPEGLLWNVMLAELLSFGYVDYLDRGESKGPSQISRAMMRHYGLHGDRSDIRTNIYMTAEKIEKQLSELFLASVARISPANVDFFKRTRSAEFSPNVPAFHNITPIDPRFLNLYKVIRYATADKLGIPRSWPRRLNVLQGFDFASDFGFTRAEREKNPMVVFELLQNFSNRRFRTEDVVKRALLTAILAHMDDVLPAGGKPAVYSRASSGFAQRFILPAQVEAIRFAMLEGKLGISDDGQLLVYGEVFSVTQTS